MPIGPIGFYPTLSGARGMEKFLSRRLVLDTTGLVRFANIRSVRGAFCADESVRILRGIINVENRRTGDWTEWHWEAVCRPSYLPSGNVGYSCDAVIIKTGPWHQPFTRKRLHDMAKKLVNRKRLTVLERIALFMDGCLMAIAINHTALISEDMIFKQPAEPRED